MQTRHTGSHVTHSASGLFMHIRQHSTVPALVFHINQDNWAAPLGLSLSSIKHERYSLLCRLANLMQSK